MQALRAGSHVFGPYWKMFFGTQFLKERPLLPRVYRPNGSIKIARLTALASSASFFGQRLRPLRLLSSAPCMSPRNSTFASVKPS